MKTVGYLVNTNRGPEGEPGLFYNYILAGNGLFVQAKNNLLRATIRIAPAEVRGLVALCEEVALIKGKIPRRLLDLALSTLIAQKERECYLAVVWDSDYHLRYPSQEGSSGGVRYETVPGTVVGIHSHGTMRPFFSSTDDEDEQGFGIYMVVGKLNEPELEVLLRVGIYGYFVPVKLDEIFG